MSLSLVTALVLDMSKTLLYVQHNGAISLSSLVTLVGGHNIKPQGQNKESISIFNCFVYTDSTMGQFLICRVWQVW